MFPRLKGFFRWMIVTLLLWTTTAVLLLALVDALEYESTGECRDCVVLTFGYLNKPL